MKQLIFVTRRPDATPKFAKGAILPVWGGPHDGSKVHFAPQDEATAVLVGSDPHVVAYRSFFTAASEKPYKSDWVLVYAPDLADDGDEGDDGDLSPLNPVTGSGGGWRP
jgi:hypothetical protein